MNDKNIAGKNDSLEMYHSSRNPSTEANDNDEEYSISNES